MGYGAPRRFLFAEASTMRSYSLSKAAIVAAVFLSSAPASADLLETTAGAKLFAGGNLWTTPSPSPGDGTIGFGGNGGGVGLGLGAYFEARLIKFLGLELGLTYDSSDLHRDVTTTVTAGGASASGTVTEKIKMASVRIPLLVKGILPVPFGRLSLGIGPEFIVPISADWSVETKSGSFQLPPADAVHADKTSSTMFTTDLGITVELPASLDLPIDLRASKNLSQGSAWTDRATLNSPTSVTVKGQSSWDFRLSAGLGYRF
jgi:hypothetical protein